jgi:hypothetical protein
MPGTSTVAEDRKQTGVRLSKDLILKLSHYALDHGISFNEALERAVAAWWEQQPEKEKYGPILLAAPAKRGPKKEDE